MHCAKPLFDGVNNYKTISRCLPLKMANARGMAKESNREEKGDLHPMPSHDIRSSGTGRDV